MKLKKLLSFLITGTMTVSCLSLSANATDSDVQNMSAKSNENVRVLYDAPLTELNSVYSSWENQLKEQNYGSHMCRTAKKAQVS